MSPHATAKPHRPTRLTAGVLLLTATLGLATTASAQLSADQQASMLLDSARRAYNEKNYPFAVTRFRDFLARFGGHRDAPQARYGLALCLIEGPERDYDKALEQLNQLAGNKAFSEYPFVLYYTGLSQRGQGVKALDTAAAKPAEAATHQNVAKQRFEEASRNFASAAVAFATKAKEAKAPAKGLPVEQEWAIRSQCDQAEMLLRLKKAKEAREAVAALVADKTWQESRYLPLALYYHGFASFLLDEPNAAGKSLSRKSVLSDEVFGTHARYLLARVHHLNTKQNEREEARLNYQGVLQDHEAARKAAQARLGQPHLFRNDPEVRARLERLIKGPSPDHVARAAFFLGVLQYEDGRFAEALLQFKNFATQNPNAALAPEARLRMGFCQAQLKQNDDAIKTLGPIAEKEPALADQALYWMARAELNKADPKKPESYRPAIDAFRKAAERSAQRAAGNPPDLRARARRGEALADMAEAQQLAGQFKDAAATYNTLITEKLLPARDDELMLNLATAHQLAGDLAASENVCGQFIAKHKDSTLLPAVLFRQAENSAFAALAAEKLPNPPDRARETTKHNDEAIKRYTALVEKYPEYAHIQLARQGLGMAHYRKGDLEKAQKALEAIPAGDRQGALAVVNYNLADILLRTAPARADDAVAAGKLEEKLKGAGELLESFLAADSPQAPDGLLKLGYCQQRLARLAAQPQEQQKTLAAARATYERLLQKFPGHPAWAQATFERAKVLALQKDVNGAINELKRFSTDPLKKSPAAPMALLHLATLLRGQNRPAEAAGVLADCRKDHEAALNADRNRAGWVVPIRYQQAVALREAGKLDEARTLFDELARTAPTRPEAWDAALRAGQCQKESGEKKLAEGRKLMAASAQQPNQRASAEKLTSDGTQELRNAVAYLASQEQALRARKPADEEEQKTLAQVRGRMLYESAWGWRKLADLEVEAARSKVQQERWQKRRDEVARLTPAGQAPGAVGLPEVLLRDVPKQPAEAQVRTVYQELIKSFPDLAVNAEARFELAEVLSQRDEHDEAVKLLQGALEAEKEPSAELTDKIKVRLGACLLDRGSRKMLAARERLASVGLKKPDNAAAEKLIEAGKKDVEAALEQMQTVTGNDKSAMLPHASYREAECQLQLDRPDEAIKLLTRFRDHGPFQNIPGVTDRALLRLGYALGEKKQWEASRQAYETLLGRFGQSPWAHEARYGVGWAYQNLAQYDNAVNSYNAVIAAVATRLGAKAQLNVGLCRLLQKRFAEAGTALLVVPFTYDYPELSALALLEAARAFNENKQQEQAVRLLRRVIKDHPGTAQAEAAQQRLAQLAGT